MYQPDEYVAGVQGIVKGPVCSFVCQTEELAQGGQREPGMVVEKGTAQSQSIELPVGDLLLPAQADLQTPQKAQVEADILAHQRPIAQEL